MQEAHTAFTIDLMNICGGTHRVTKALNPHLRTFSQWLEDNKHHLYEILDEGNAYGKFPTIGKRLDDPYLTPYHLRYVVIPGWSNLNHSWFIGPLT
jgi:hypothetical protein